MPHECTNCSRTFADGSKEMLTGCPDCGGNKFQFVPSQSTRESSTSSGSESSSSSQSQPLSSNQAERSSSDTAIERSSSNAVEESERSRVSQTKWPQQDISVDVEASDSADSVSEWPETARRPAERQSTDSVTESMGLTDTDDQAQQHDSELADHRSSDSTATMSETEDSAQATARTDVVSPDELPATDDEHDGSVAGHKSEPPPDHGRVVSEPTSEQPSIDELRKELNEQFESIKIVRPGEYELNLMELYNREEYIVSLQEDGRYVINVPDSWRD